MKKTPESLMPLQTVANQPNQTKQLPRASCVTAFQEGQLVVSVVLMSKAQVIVTSIVLS